MRLYPTLLTATVLAWMASAAPADVDQRQVASSTANAPAASTSAGSVKSKRYVAYWSIFHARTVIPSAAQLKGVTHLILSFVNLDSAIPVWVGEAPTNSGWDKSTVQALQAQGIKVGVAVGGWGYDNAFRPASKSDSGRKAFAASLISWCQLYGLDGIDLDWEYPVDNGANYLLPDSDPKSRRRDDTDGPNFVLLAQEIRNQLDTYGTQVNKSPFMSIAVPAKPIDMVAYKVSETTAGLDAVVDFWNLMSYDFVNRRDTKTGHHAGTTVIQETFAAYTALNIAKSKLNVGFPMYAKWFAINSTCSTAPYTSCDLGSHEFPDTGIDMANSGSVTFNFAVADNQARVDEFRLIDQDAHSDADHHASSFVGTSTEWGNIFWTWLSARDVEASCKANIEDAGGIMFWSINQDTADLPHITALQRCLGLA